MALWIFPVVSEPFHGASEGNLNRTSCHSELLSQLGPCYSCKVLPELRGHIWEQEEEHFCPGPASSLCDVFVREKESEGKWDGLVKS